MRSCPPREQEGADVDDFDEAVSDMLNKNVGDKVFFNSINICLFYLSIYIFQLITLQWHLLKVTTTTKTSMTKLQLTIHRLLKPENDCNRK